MAPLLYSVTMSLDGFIAGAGGDMSWLAMHLDPNPTAERLMEQVGAILTGNRTYGGDDPNRGDPDKEGAFGGAWHGPQFVLTHHPPERRVEDVTFVTDLTDAVAAAQAAAGEKYVNVLGANVAKQCLEARLLDEILVIVAPVLIGDGVRLFDHPGGTNVMLERISLTHTPTVSNHWFRVIY